MLSQIRNMAAGAMAGWERLESGVGYNPVSAAVRDNPYALYDALRTKDPVHRMRTLRNAWLLTRYRDIDAVLRDHKRFSNGRRGFAYTELRTLLHSDPPDHTRLRGLILKAFTPRAVDALEARIRGIVDDLLDKAADDGAFELMNGLAFPLPVTVIAEMLGIPPGDRDRFDDWSNRLALSVEPILSARQIAEIRTAWDEIFEYFDSIIGQRLADPQDDLVSALLAAEENDAKLTREEVQLTLLLLLVAGNETTRNLIGNGMLALLRNPDQLARLRAHPELMDPAIAELLRYDSPVQLNGRVVEEDTEIGGKTLRAGDQVLCALGAANRDPEIFTDPHRLDIARREASHLSFGRGIHYCLGAALAVREAGAAFDGMLKRFGEIRLAAEPAHRNRIVLRGLKELNLSVEAA